MHDAGYDKVARKHSRLVRSRRVGVSSSAIFVIRSNIPE